MTSSDN